MTTYETETNESIDARTKRALTDCMTVLDEGGDIFTVVGENQNGEYQVDARMRVCSCDDYKYRQPANGCKHVRRVAFATGEVPIPDGVEGVDEQLGAHVSPESNTEPNDQQRVATDGGRDQTRVPCAGGVLVFEPRELGKELVGFEEVTDWDDVADALRARGLDHGAIYNLPVFDDSETEHTAEREVTA